MLPKILKIIANVVKNDFSSGGPIMGWFLQKMWHPEMKLFLVCCLRKRSRKTFTGNVTLATQENESKKIETEFFEFLRSIRSMFNFGSHNGVDICIKYLVITQNCVDWVNNLMLSIIHSCHYKAVLKINFNIVSGNIHTFQKYTTPVKRCWTSYTHLKTYLWECCQTKNIEDVFC